MEDGWGSEEQRRLGLGGTRKGRGSPQPSLLGLNPHRHAMTMSVATSTTNTTVSRRRRPQGQAAAEVAAAADGKTMHARTRQGLFPVVVSLSLPFNSFASLELLRPSRARPSVASKPGCVCLCRPVQQAQGDEAAGSRAPVGLDECDCQTGRHLLACRQASPRPKKTEVESEARRPFGIAPVR